MAKTGFTLNGLNLRTLALEILSTSGWDTFPGVKSSGVQYAFTHGEYIGGRRFYRARDIDLNMIILDTNAAGQVVTTPLEHIEENIETLMGALHDTFNPLTLVRTLPSGVTRTAFVRPVDVLRYEDHVGISRIVTLTLRMGYPFWHGAAFNQVVSGTTSITMNGTAPVNDFSVVFTTAGRITHSPTGDYIESSAAGITVDLSKHEDNITGGDPADISSNTPWWLQLEKGSNGLVVTGGNKTLSGFHGYF